MDYELDEALYWDYFARSYGWTKDEAETQNPSWLLDRLAMIGQIRGEIEQERSESD